MILVQQTGALHFPVVWIAFILYWRIKAADTKTTQGLESAAWPILRALTFLIVIVLLSIRRIPLPWLNRQLWPSGIWSLNRRKRGDDKPETFNFLGFTHSCGKTRKGHFTVLRQTMRQRWQAKLRALKVELRRRMHRPIREQGTYLRSVLMGHFRYYGVPMNGPALCAFRHAVGYLWRTVLRRRSQGNHMPWRRRKRYIQRWFPPAQVCHPYPLVRLGVVTQGGSRMR